MKTRSMMFYAVALIIALGMSQGVMAKEKKVKYLGHNYKGEVNDKKVPAGKGIMNVNGLMIEGVFSDHSVSNANVWRTEVLGTSNTTFSGTITYDESENIVLKAGGVISTKYYYSKDIRVNDGVYINEDKKPDYAKETLKDDRIVNSSSFESKELTLSYSIRKDIGKVFGRGVSDILHIPTLLASYTVGLTNGIDYHKRVYKDVFAAIEHYYENKLLKPIELGNYKDNEGRIWGYTTARPGSDNGYAEKLTVEYPNGSYLEYEDKGYYRPQFIFWEIHYPNGKIIKANWSDSDREFALVYDMGRFKMKPGRISNDQVIEIFANNVNKEKFMSPNHREISITSDSLDFSKLSNSETEKFIREEVIPYIENGTSEDVTYTTPNGIYKKGVFTSNEQKATAKAKRLAAEDAAINKSITSFKKKYGFDPSVNDVRYIVKVGRNLLHILDARNEWVDEYADNRNNKVTVKLARDQGARKCYHFYWFNTAYYCGYFWVNNNVITSIHWGR